MEGCAAPGFRSGGRCLIVINPRTSHIHTNTHRMLDLVAQNAAIEDALYHMDRALANGDNLIDLPTFLKVRE